MEREYRFWKGKKVGRESEDGRVSEDGRKCRTDRVNEEERRKID